MGIKLINISKFNTDESRINILNKCMEYTTETSYKPIVYLNLKSFNKINPFSNYYGEHYYTENSENKITVDGVEYKIRDEIYIGYRRVEIDDDILLLS